MEAGTKAAAAELALGVEAVEAELLDDELLQALRSRAPATTTPVTAETRRQLWLPRLSLFLLYKECLRVIEV